MSEGGIPTLVLVPGLMCDHAVWSAMRQHMPAWDDRVHVADHGLRDSLEGMASQILEAVTGPLAVAGHSMGGRVALEMVRLAPKRIRHLALLDTGFDARPSGVAGQTEADKRHSLLEVARRDGVAAMAEQWVQGMVHPDRLSDQALINDIVAMFARRSADHFAAQIRALLARPDATPQLASIAGPVWLVCGEQDSWSPVSQHERMAQCLADPHLAIIDEAGHMAPMERPEAMAQVLLQWLQSAPLQASLPRAG